MAFNEIKGFTIADNGWAKAVQRDKKISLLKRAILKITTTDKR